GTLYFSAMDGINGPQLWKSDGTAAGTAMVTDFQQASLSPSMPDSSSVVDAGGAIFFEGGTPMTGAGYTVFRNDGTPAGTSPIFSAGPSTVAMSGLTVSGSSLYFLTYESGDTGNVIDLWRSDGTATGTAVIASIPNAYGYSVGALSDVNGK